MFTYGFDWNVERVVREALTAWNDSDDGSNTTKADFNGSIRLAPNPAALKLMTTHYGFTESDLYGLPSSISASSSSSSSSNSNNSKLSSVNYLTLQSLQNEAWSKSKVAEGIEAARQGKYALSIELCNNALSLHHDSVEGLVCRAAASANLSKFEPAVRDLQRALELDPTHQNAKEYLTKVTAKWDRKTSLPTAVVLPTSDSSKDGKGNKGLPLAASKVKLTGETTTTWLQSSAVDAASNGGNGTTITAAAALTINGYSFVDDDDDDDALLHRGQQQQQHGNGNVPIRKRSKETDSDDSSTDSTDSRLSHRGDTGIPSSDGDREKKRHEKKKKKHSKKHKKDKKEHKRKKRKKDKHD